VKEKISASQFVDWGLAPEHSYMHGYWVPDSQPNERGMLTGRKGNALQLSSWRRCQRIEGNKGPGIFEENRDIQFVYTLGDIVYGYKWSRENLRECIFLLEDDGHNAALFLSKMIEYVFWYLSFQQPEDLILH